jgi:hypothetical protein
MIKMTEPGVNEKLMMQSHPTRRAPGRDSADRPNMASSAERLRNPETRLTELAAMEELPPSAVADAADAAAALSELRALDVEEVPREVFERASVLLARLVLGAADDPAHPVIAAAYANGRLASFLDVSVPRTARSAQQPAARP